jgi:hypothetical protein
MGQLTSEDLVPTLYSGSVWPVLELLLRLRSVAIVFHKYLAVDFVSQNVPLYEFLRQHAGTHKPYILPVPFFNVLNGGVHSGNLMAFQEFMIAPVGANSIAHAVQIGSEVYQELKAVVKAKFGGSGEGYDQLFCVSPQLMFAKQLVLEMKEDLHRQFRSPTRHWTC